MHQADYIGYGHENEKRRIFWRVRFFVSPNETGFLYNRNKLEAKLGPGIYDRFDYGKNLSLVTLPSGSRLQNILNQEVLTKDNIALRFSYFVEYHVEDPEKLLARFDMFNNRFTPFLEVEQIIHNLTQVYFRRAISEIDAEELNAKRNDILPETPEELKKDLADYGIAIDRLMVRDLTFPKSIQDLISKTLEAKIRSKADLENARTQVAAARALKNASELMKGDEEIKFIQYLETITKIAEKGKHTFLIGDLSQKAVNLNDK